MKHIYISIVLCVLMLTSSCLKDEWKDELYEHKVSLKAPIDGEDVSSVFLRYKSNGETTYSLPVLVSGSLTNKQHLNIKIGVDRDTLAILNEARYGSRTDLYFRQLGDNHFEFPSSTCEILPGEDQALFDVKFKFSGLNLVDKWVLPLTIEKDDSYITNDFKGRRKALLYLKLFNDYSGIYSSTSMEVYFGDETKNPTAQGTREARVVDENTVFFYAGLTEEKALERELYKIYVKFKPVEEKPDGTEFYGLEVWAEHKDDIGFQLISSPENTTYEIKEEMDKTQPFLLHRYITMRMEYKYEDVTSSSQVAIPYRCKGSMLLQRKINTLAPDEDQAILW